MATPQHRPSWSSIVGMTLALLGGMAALGVGVAASGAAAPADNAGASLYQTKCAGCHDNPSGRTPARARLAAMTTPEIVNTLTIGVMRAQGSGLTADQAASIASYLSQSQHAAAPSDPDSPPPCADGAVMTTRGPQWNGWGAGTANQRYQPHAGLSAAQVAQLKPKWAVKLTGDKAGQPTLMGGRLYIANMSGVIYSLNARTGCAYWKYKAPGMVRTTIALGTLPGPEHRLAAFFMDIGVHVYAIDAATGAPIWRVKIDDQTGAIGTGSPTFYNGRVYIGVSSGEELFAQSGDYPCCKFRGSLVALDAANGKQLWKTYTTDEVPHQFAVNPKGNPMYGPAGGAIWSAPTIDPKRRLIYVGTGNAYTDVEYSGADSILAFDLASGALKWAQHFTRNNPSVMGCWRPPYSANCPKVLGPDFDFGSSPLLVTTAGGKQLVLAGQKSSQVYALDPDQAGKVVWTTRLSPGSSQGGVEFGSATDGRSIYVGLADVYAQNGAKPGLTALRLADGAVRWSTPSPALPCRWTGDWCHPGLSQAVTAIPGVVFAGALNGRFRAYSSVTGKVIWEQDTGQPVPTLNSAPFKGGVLDGGGPVVVGGMVYEVSGYGGRQGNNPIVLIAYSPDGK